MTHWNSFLSYHQFFVDIDECKEGINGCLHDCLNNQGSYECKCRSGFILAPDKMTCKGNN